MKYCWYEIWKHFDRNILRCMMQYAYNSQNWSMSLLLASVTSFPGLGYSFWYYQYHTETHTGQRNSLSNMLRKLNRYIEHWTSQLLSNSTLDTISFSCDIKRVWGFKIVLLIIHKRGFPFGPLRHTYVFTSLLSVLQIRTRSSVQFSNGLSIDITCV
jgi:hypothetical protein